MKSLMLSSLILLGLLPNIGFSKSKCVAHRGNNKLHFENSMPSLISAYMLGSDAVEFDIVMTKDGVPILNHDKELKRVARSKKGKSCDLESKVSEQNFEDIRTNCQLNDGSEVASLKDVLKYFHDKEIILFIELKSKPSNLTLELVEKYYSSNPERLRVISFKKKYLKVLKKEAKISQFWGNVKRMRVSKAVPKMLGVDGVDINIAAIGLIFIPKMFGLETAVWTVNKAKNIKLANKMNVDFITTDDPKLCLSIVK